MAGRPKKVENEQMISRRCSAGWRLKCYREQNCTQEQLAEQLNVSVATIRRYENGKLLIPADIARKLSTISGQPVEYWQGYSQDEIDFFHEMYDEMDGEDTDFITHCSAIRSMTVRYNTFLAVFDTGHSYKYRYIGDTPDYESDGVPDPSGCIAHRYRGPHLIESASDPSIWVSVAEVPTTPAGWCDLIHSLEQKRSA